MANPVLYNKYLLNDVVHLRPQNYDDQPISSDLKMLLPNLSFQTENSDLVVKLGRCFNDSTETVLMRGSLTSMPSSRVVLRLVPPESVARLESEQQMNHASHVLGHVVIRHNGISVLIGLVLKRHGRSLKKFKERFFPGGLPSDLALKMTYHMFQTVKSAQEREPSLAHGKISHKKFLLSKEQAWSFFLIGPKDPYLLDEPVESQRETDFEQVAWTALELVWSHPLWGPTNSPESIASIKWNVLSRIDYYLQSSFPGRTIPYWIKGLLIGLRQRCSTRETLSYLVNQLSVTGLNHRSYVLSEHQQSLPLNILSRQPVLEVVEREADAEAAHIGRVQRGYRAGAAPVLDLALQRRIPRPPSTSDEPAVKLQRH